MTIKILQGHVLDVLATLPEKHVSVCVTSPPYWQLRAYGTEPQVWQCEDGDALCAPEQHEWGEPSTRLSGRNDCGRDLTGSGGHYPNGGPAKVAVKSAFCAHCHAWRGEYGQEPTPELYLWHTVLWTRAVRRVLRDDGTLFVNIAGCYWSDPGGQNGANLRNGMGASTLTGSNLKNKAVSAISAKAIEANRQNGRKEKGRHPVYKPLDYVDIPGLVARALQADGWTWRSDVVWVKPSALPESVSGTRWERCRTKLRSQPPPGGSEAHRYNAESGNRTARPNSGGFANVPEAYQTEWADCSGCPRCAATEGLVLRRGSGRPTKATERILLFTRGPGYYFDQEAVREGLAEATVQNLASSIVHLTNEKQDALEPGRNAGLGVGRPKSAGSLAGRNLRDWWVIGPEPLKDAHYAAYPSALPERCIKAGSSERGCCPACGSPWARVVDSKPNPSKGYNAGEDMTGGAAKTGNAQTSAGLHRNPGGVYAETTTLGWRPTCACPPHQPVPCRVLDPFGGAGTTGVAADRLGRDAILVELKPEYARLAERRLNRDAPLLMWGAVSLEGADGGEGEAAG